MSESDIGANTSDYAEGRATPELSDSHPDASPEVNEVNSDDFANEQASPSAAAKEEEREAPTDIEESNREEKMDSSNRGAVGDSDDEPLVISLCLLIFGLDCLASYVAIE
ncbi:uncharacterized protein LOC131255188 [Magnolia sinica]|uniref:uncharacterized protein LOC131255188 n=1 Tax=Magnolia sinica TaxID=86752 RepID=UPI002657D0E0|nr:uncharacterized protein LOC131255188 [Magnolia sinica]